MSMAFLFTILNYIMKKQQLLLSFYSLLLIFNVSAYGRTFYIDGSLGQTFSDAELTESQTKVDSQELNYQISFGYHVLPDLTVGIDVLFGGDLAERSSETYITGSGGGYDEIESTTEAGKDLSYHLTAAYYIVNNEDFKLYSKLALGMTSAELYSKTERDYFVENTPDLRLNDTQADGTDFTYKIGAGGEYSFNETHSAFLDIQYAFEEIGVEGTHNVYDDTTGAKITTVDITDEIDLSGFELRVGYRFSF